MQRILVVIAAALTLTACSYARLPTSMEHPDAARVDADRLMACAEVSILLDRRVDFEPTLRDFLDVVRGSGCDYRRFRVDMARSSIMSSFRDGYAQESALGVVRSYRRGYGLDWKAMRYQIDPRIPTYHLKVSFMNAAVRPVSGQSV